MKLEATQHQEVSITDLFEEYFREHFPSLDIELNANLSLYQNIQLLCKNHGKPFAGECNKALEYAYDIKYGDWDNVNDLRKLYGSEWSNPIRKYFENITSSDKIIDIGCNDGRELKDLLLANFNKPKITLIDISKNAIRKLQNAIEHRHVEIINQSFLDTKFKKNSFDFCVSFRTLHSSGIDTGKSIEKCYYITKPNGLIVLSVSNGYIDENTGEPLKGMYEYSTGKVNEKKPYEIAESMAQKLRELGVINVQIIDGSSEIFIVACKNGK